MAPPEDDAPADSEEKKERNQFRDTLIDSKGTVRTCGDTVYGGLGSPLDAIANPVADGGWVCTEASTWVTEMTGQCAGIVEAFDDAVSTIQQRIGVENGELKVPENDWRGDSWPRQWVVRRRNL